MLIYGVGAVGRGSNPVIFYIFPGGELEKHVQELLIMLKRILQACSCYFSINIIGSFFASTVHPRQERSFFISFPQEQRQTISYKSDSTLKNTLALLNKVSSSGFYLRKSVVQRQNYSH